ncbi:MAG: hypothetical protein IJ414_02155 [Campylobacter sp.]|uniref:hypothetical protein n=1 Tax=Campylobacter sp. TaxID=205 RepID=UPI00259D22EE|nr:hypothetical protein [Campylobacter sp.]MBQ8608935.1 hypothetical protein [Campylobacter sp.]
MAKIFKNRLRAYQIAKLKVLNAMPVVILFLKPYRKIAKVIIHIGKVMIGITMLIKNKFSNLPTNIKVKHKIIAIKPHTLRVKFLQNIHISHTQTRAIILHLTISIMVLFIKLLYFYRFK